MLLMVRLPIAPIYVRTAMTRGVTMVAMILLGQAYLKPLSPLILVFVLGNVKALEMIEMPHVMEVVRFLVV